MTASQSLDALDHQIKRRLLSGETKASICRSLHIGKSTLYRRVDKLVYLGEIRAIPGTVSPMGWEDPRRDGYTVSLRDTVDPENGTVDMGGIESGTEPSHFGGPNSEVRVHISGAYRVTLVSCGECSGALRDEAGYTIGGWSEPRHLKRSDYTPGFIRVMGQDIKFRVHRDKEGIPTNLVVYPVPAYLYYKEATARGRQAMEGQALTIVRILERHGFVFSGPPILKGVLHYGSLRPELLRHASRQVIDDSAAVHHDASHGEPEIEIYDRPDAQDDIDLIQELPDHIRAIERSIVALSSTMRESARLIGTMCTAISQLGEVAARQATQSAPPAYEGANEDYRRSYA